MFELFIFVIDYKSICKFYILIKFEVFIKFVIQYSDILTL